MQLRFNQQESCPSAIDSSRGGILQVSGFLDSRFRAFKAEGHTDVGQHSTPHQESLLGLVDLSPHRDRDALLNSVSRIEDHAIAFFKTYQHLCLVVVAVS